MWSKKSSCVSGGRSELPHACGLLPAAGGESCGRKGRLAARLLQRLWAALLTLFIGSCAVGPNYQRPALPAPPGFRGAETNSTLSLAELPWWELFKDEPLQKLIREALTNNLDLRIAIARVEQARALAVQARGQFFPQLGYEAAAGRGKNAAGSTLLFNGGRTVNTFALGGNASWEIDLWGRLRRLNEAERAQYLASEEAQRTVTVSLIGEVAQAYFQLLALDRQLEIAQHTTNAFGESLRIFSQRLEQGIVSKLETSSAEALLASTAATVPDLMRQVVMLENQLSVLLGRNPGPIERHAPALEDFSFPEVPPGLPSSLLERRPDIREAEQILRARNAQVGVAMADFFPRLSLTALFGQASPELSMLTSGGASAWSVAAGLTGPLFQGGRLRGAYQQRLAEREEARLQYQQVVLTAFQEVSDALFSRRAFADARVQQARAVRAYETAVQVSRERYIAGKAGYYEMLQEQQLLFPAENILVQTQLNELLALVRLYRALGGGWELR